MREFIDLRVRKPPEPTEFERMILTTKEMGYRHLGVVSNSDNMSGENPLGMDVINRVELFPTSPGELLSSLSRIKKRFGIVAVSCSTKAVARQAAKDHRVDVLMFQGDLSERKIIGLDEQEATLAARTGCSFEISAIELICASSARITKLLTLLKKEIAIARRHDIPIIMSSGATTALELREPRALSAILDLLDIGEESAFDMISTNPLSIVDRSRRELKPSLNGAGRRRL
jgi:ribonuclease P/MRP protein subunit RPP1